MALDTIFYLLVTSVLVLSLNTKYYKFIYVKEKKIKDLSIILYY